MIERKILFFSLLKDRKRNITFKLLKDRKRVRATLKNQNKVSVLGDLRDRAREKER